VEDTDQYGRTVGRVYAGQVDVNAELVRRSAVWVYRQYNRDQRCRRSRPRRAGPGGASGPCRPASRCRRGKAPQQRQRSGGWGATDTSPESSCHAAADEQLRRSSVLLPPVRAQPPGWRSGRCSLREAVSVGRRAKRGCVVPLPGNALPACRCWSCRHMPQSVTAMSAPDPSTTLVVAGAKSAVEVEADIAPLPIQAATSCSNSVAREQITPGFQSRT
jgi:hypothetical protein